MNAPDVSNLGKCTIDCLKGALSNDAGPRPPKKFDDVMSRLAAARAKLPPLYRQSFADPLVSTLQSLGEGDFDQIIAAHNGSDLFLLDFVEAVVQNGEKYREQSTDAFQEVVSDLYDGFLSAEDRRGVKHPDRGVIPPLVKWGNPSFGPYTRPMDVAKRNLGVGATVVSLPPAMALRGLAAWASLAHETAGHDILTADVGLPFELANLIESSLRKAKAPAGLPSYWSERIDETAADVMGILNMGPAAAIGLIVLLRGFRGSASGPGTLLNDGRESDEHPVDVLRGFLGAAVVRRLKFSGAAGWAAAIEAETRKDITGITIVGQPVSVAAAKKSAEVVASALMHTRLDSLDKHALADVQDWRDGDEAIIATLMKQLAAASPMPQHYPSDVYAAHVVAAAVYASMAKGSSPTKLFPRMLVALKVMHDTNPAWGPLYVVHRGDVEPHMAMDRIGESAPKRVADRAAASKRR